jgi:predicted transcriptional regulator
MADARLRRLRIDGGRLDPRGYRERWERKRDYPMTAHAYSAKRSELAQKLGPRAQSRRAHRNAAAAVNLRRKGNSPAEPKRGGARQPPRAAP